MTHIRTISRANLPALVLSFAAAIGTVAACSSTPAPSEPGTHVTDVDMTGCLPLSEASGACYEVDGAYSPAGTTGCAATVSDEPGPSDTHCKGVAPQEVSASACSVKTEDAGSGDAGTPDARAGADAGTSDAAPAVGLCGAPPGNVATADSDYGATMYGTSGDDDDCKYHVSYEAAPVCGSDGVYFIVKANYLTRDGAPLTGACTQAEMCLNNEHPATSPNDVVGSETVVEGPPGTYTIGPVTFDAPGKWTVRFHFNELCCDVSAESPHGHAAFFVKVP
jgi:hypothetical protein